jgi:hypothetical protein
VILAVRRTNWDFAGFTFPALETNTLIGILRREIGVHEWASDIIWICVSGGTNQTVSGCVTDDTLSNLETVS